MYKFLAAGFLIALCAACNRATPSDSTAETTAPSTSSTGEPIPEESIPIGSGGLVPKVEETTPLDTDNLHINEAVGFQFLYPEGFRIASEGEFEKGQYVSLLREQDIGMPEPLVIFISIYNNPEQLPLKDFRDQEIRIPVTDEKSNTKVADQTALDFDADGLYLNRNLLFGHPSKAFVAHISASYFGPEPSEDDPMWQASKSIANSWQWTKL
ncbi:MAG: hypothetical protein AAFU53_06675 [Cyanobacteria bacterium J06632_3]